MDYILVHELAEERSLAHILQLDEKEVRKALQILEKHEILCSEEVYAEFFKNKYMDKLGLRQYYQETNQVPSGNGLETSQQFQNNLVPNLSQSGRGNSKVTMYYFNINLIYVLTARMHLLEQMLGQKVQQNKR